MLHMEASEVNDWLKENDRTVRWLALKGGAEYTGFTRFLRGERKLRADWESGVRRVMEHYGRAQ